MECSYIQKATESRTNVATKKLQIENKTISPRELLHFQKPVFDKH